MTPAYLFVILGWWAVSDALPILRLERAAGGGPLADGALPYLLVSRGILLALLVGFLILIRIAWQRNGYDDHAGFHEPASQGGVR